MYTNLIVTFLGKETALSDDQVECTTCHQKTMSHVTKHHSKQEGECNDCIWSCNRQHHTSFQVSLMPKAKKIVQFDI